MINFWQSMRVRGARKKAGVDYPNMYAPAPRHNLISRDVLRPPLTGRGGGRRSDTAGRLQVRLCGRGSRLHEGQG